MPESPEEDLKRIENEAMQFIVAASDERQKKVEVIPVAFGLESINITFLCDEKKADMEPLQEKISGIAGVQSVEVSDMRRIIG